MDQKEVFEIIKRLTGQSYVLTVPREFILRLDGDVGAALFLSQLLYWSDKGRGEWIYKSYAEWEAELCMKPKKLMAIRAKLQAIGLISTKVRKANGTPTLHYRINEARLVDWLAN